MSENQNRGSVDYTKYDSMPTDKLEEILRLDAQSSEGVAPDGELILYVMEVLAKRKETSKTPGITAQTAWESFNKHYLPTEEERIIEDAQEKPTGKAPRHLLRRAVAVAAVLVILVGVPLTAGAFGWRDIWNAVAKWAKETISFVTGADTQVDEPVEEDVRQYTSLQDLLAQTDQEYDFVPTWIPEEYTLRTINMDENPMRKSYYAVYTSGERIIRISVQSYMDADPEKVEINGELLETYEASGVEYYILQNNQQLYAAWIKGSYECNISGDLTVEEIKMMIDSIGKG